MQLPFFYIESFDSAAKTMPLDEDNSKHIIQVLRMKAGEQLNLTDGKGNLLSCQITEANKKKCIVEIREIQNLKSKIQNIAIGISLLKNPARFEWFLEKATELGISEIIPLICERTEKEKFRYERMQGICISAMLQSRQVWLPVLLEPIEFKKAVEQSFAQQKFIAHCEQGSKQSISQFSNSTIQNPLILIGPEGDFTIAEIEMALKNNFVPVSLGETRLRTETAGVVAAVLLSQS